MNNRNPITGLPFLPEPDLSSEPVTLTFGPDDAHPPLPLPEEENIGDA